MEETNKDAQDSETSSTSSWILLNSDEAVEYKPSQEINQVPMNEEIYFKSNNSDVESDGISIISESEFSHDGKSDDDSALSVGDDKGEDIFENTDAVLEVEEKNIYEQFQDISELDNEDSDSYQLIAENSVELSQEENEEDIDTTIKEMNNKISEDIETNYGESVIPKETASIVQNKISETLVSNCPVQVFDYKKLLTWPSLLGTSVVIFAVLIFPYFSSKINENMVDQSNTDQYDVHLLNDKKIIDIDPLAYCKEIHKSDDLYLNYHMKKCVKKMIKQIKKAKKHNIAKDVTYLDKGINDKKSDDIVIENQEIEINYKKMYKKENEKGYKHQKYMKKYKYNAIDKNKKSFQKEDEYNFESKEGEGHTEKNWKFGGKEITPKESNIDLKDHDLNIKTKQGDFEFIYEDNGENIVKRWNYIKKVNANNEFKHDELNESSEILSQAHKLNEKEKYLLEKERILNEWEKKLIEKEKQLQDQEKRKQDENEGIFSRREQPKKMRMRKGDFDEDDSRKNKFKKNKKSYFDEKAGEYEKNSKDKFYKRIIENDQEINEKEHKEDSKVKYQKKRLDELKFFLNENMESFTLPEESHDKKSIDDVNTNTNTQYNSSKYFKIHSFPKKNQTKLFDDDNITLTGEWYLNLVQGRHDIRKKEEKAVWWFDRAELRKNKRNKAFWYFQYMFNRENMRYRPKNI